MDFPLFDGVEQGKSGSAVCTYVHFYFIIAKKPALANRLWKLFAERLRFDIYFVHGIEETKLI